MPHSYPPWRLINKTLPTRAVAYVGSELYCQPEPLVQMVAPWLSAVYTHDRLRDLQHQPYGCKMMTSLHAHRKRFDPIRVSWQYLRNEMDPKIGIADDDGARAAAPLGCVPQ